MFQKLKRALIKKNKLNSYLKYAVGEIILIVIGILIAVSINNWNKERQRTELKKGIFEVVLNDLKSDTAEVSKILEYYENRRSTFKRVVNNDLSKTEIKQCNICKYIITSRKLISINERGFSQLNDYQNSSVQHVDSLASDIINFYSVTTNSFTTLNDLIETDISNNLKIWRDKYPWYKDFVFNKQLNEEAINYFRKSREYKNYVAYHYTIVYNNYVPVLKYFQNRSKKLLERIDHRLQSS